MIIADAFLPATSAALDRNIGPISIMDYGNYWIGVTFSGADVAGTLQLQGAATIDFARPFNIGSSVSVTTSTDQSFTGDGVAYPYIRLVWDYSSGTGNITVDYAIRQPRLWGGG